MIDKIISGGQTGADRAALDVAMELGIPHGGWIPQGRRTEEGKLPEGYRLRETKSIDYAQRTGLNVVDSDGTLIASHGELAGGSALTQKMAAKRTRSAEAASSVGPAGKRGSCHLRSHQEAFEGGSETLPSKDHRRGG